MSDEPVPLPEVVRLLWRRDGPPRRGPKPSLSIDAIVAGGIAVADAEGLDAVTMARVAAEIGVPTMTLYRYVDTKLDLLTLMADVGLGLPPANRKTQSWRAGLTRWATQLRDRWNVRPWLIQLPINGPPLGPYSLAWLDSGLAALASSPIAETEHIDVLVMLNTFVRGCVMLTAHAGDPATLDSPETDATFNATLDIVLAAESHPLLRRRLDDGLGATTADDPFAFGLRTLLDGLEASAARRTGAQ